MIKIVAATILTIPLLAGCAAERERVQMVESMQFVDRTCAKSARPDNCREELSVLEADRLQADRERRLAFAMAIQQSIENNRQQAQMRAQQSAQAASVGPTICKPNPYQPGSLTCQPRGY